MAPSVDREPMHSSIGASHNIGSCSLRISAGTFREAIRCLSRSPQRLVRPRTDYPLCGAAERAAVVSPSHRYCGGALAGAAVGAAATRGSLGGILIGAVVGGLVGNLVGRALDKEEQRKLNEATQQAFSSETGQVTTYSVPSKTPGKEPTTVSAKAVGPPTTRTSGATCRPIEQTATKNGQTLTETVSLCQNAGGSAGELKPTSI